MAAGRWIAPHNSFLHMIYRGGIIGLLAVIATIAALVSLTRRFLRLAFGMGRIN